MNKEDIQRLERISSALIEAADGYIQDKDQMKMFFRLGQLMAQIEGVITDAKKNLAKETDRFGYTMLPTMPPQIRKNPDWDVLTDDKSDYTIEDAIRQMKEE